MDTTQYFCNVAALSSQQRDRYQSLAEPLFKSVSSISEQPNGYDIIFPMNQDNFTLFAEFVVYESLCCSFLSFALSLSSGEQDATLSITGPQDAKPFIRSELGLK